MLVNLSKYAIVIITCFACESSHEPNQDTLKSIPENDTTISVKESISKSEFGLWRDLEAFPSDWIKVERDSLGFLIYEPCDGSTPRIVIADNRISAWCWVEECSNCEINRMVFDGNSATIEGNNDRVNTHFYIETKDEEQGLALWTFENFKWLMTPLENKMNFRQVHNPCPDQKIPEKTFLPLEY